FARQPGAGERMTPAPPAETGAKNLWPPVSSPFWLPYAIGTEPGAGLRQAPGVADSGCAAQAFLDETPAPPGARGAGAAVAPCSRQEPCHTESLAMDLGRR